MSPTTDHHHQPPAVVPRTGAMLRKAVVLGHEPASSLRSRLADDGFHLREYALPHQFFRELHTFSPCLVLACTPLQDAGHEPVVRRIRDLFGHAAPIVVIGGDEDGREHLAALEAGADDYIGRDTGLDITMARIRALMRRYPGAPADGRCVNVGEYCIDYSAQRITVGGCGVALTPKEFDLFWVFAARFGRLISKAELMGCVWGQNHDLDTHTLSQHVHALRRKLRLSEHGLQLTALYGAGYRLERLGGLAGPGAADAEGSGRVRQ